MTDDKPTPRISTGVLPTAAGRVAAPPPVRQQTNAGSSGRNIVVANAGFTEPRVDQPKEKILLSGDTTSGKTFAYMRLCLKLTIAALEAEKDPPRFFVIDTDAATNKMIGPGFEFESLSFTNGGPMYTFPAYTYEEQLKALNTIINKYKPQQGDWIVVDLISRVYDQTLHYVARSEGMEIDQAAFDKLKAGKGFGAFESGQWNMVNRAYFSFMNTLVLGSPANILATAHVQDMIDAAGWERREQLALYDAIGIRPDGHKRTTAFFDTAIVLWAKRVIQRDERKRRIGAAKTVRMMWIAKDRDSATAEETEFGTDAFDVLFDWRKEKINRTAVPEGATLIDKLKAIRDGATKE